MWKWGSTLFSLLDRSICDVRKFSKDKGFEIRGLFLFSISLIIINRGIIWCENTNHAKGSEMKMRIFRLRKMTLLALSTAIVNAMMWWCAIPSLVAPSAVHAKATSQAELAYVTNQSNGTISVIDPKTKKVMDTIWIGGDPKAIAITPDGREAYIGGVHSNAIEVINTKTKAVISTINVGKYAYAVATTPDGKEMYVTGENQVSVIDTKTHTVTQTISLSNGNNYAIAISPDGNEAYVTSYEKGGNYRGMISIIDIHTHTITHTFAVAGEHTPEVIAFSPDNQQAYVGNYEVITVIDRSIKKVIDTIPIGEFFNPEDMVIAPNGRRAYVAKHDLKSGKHADEVLVIDIPSRQIIKRIPIKNIPFGIAMTSDGSEVYVTNANHKSISVIDTHTNMVIRTISVGDRPWHIAIAPCPSP
jgi:YVTN family beta-propeller protein